jgi:hypothetical protein
MNCCDNDKAKQGSQASGLKAWVSGPRRWWLLGAVAVAAGLALGWDTLVLFGIAPILIALLPCLVMCGLGLCMMKCKDKKSATTEQGDVAAKPAPSAVEPATANPAAAHSLSKEGT